MTSDSDLFAALGFRWNRARLPDPPMGDADRRAEVLQDLRDRIALFAWDAAKLEGNPASLAQAEALARGEGGLDLDPFDQTQIRNLLGGFRAVADLVEAGEFRLDKPGFCKLHALIAREEALEWGWFRGEGRETSYTPHVGLGAQGSLEPSPTLPGAPELNRLFSEGVEVLEAACPPLERALAFVLFGALQQFFFDGNKRTSRLMASGLLLTHGLPALSIPASEAARFDALMVRFYLSRDGTEMTAFLLDLLSAARPQRGG